MNIYEMLDMRRNLRAAMDLLEEAIQNEQVRMLNNGEAQLINGCLVYLADAEQIAKGKAEELAR